MNNRTKKIFKFFTISDYDKEQVFLREQHKKGYKITHLSLLGIYKFEPCTPEDVIYQLDFCDKNTLDNDCYVQSFKDSGWEYLFNVNGWNYFRKPADSVDGNTCIFTDKESKLQLIKNLFYRKMLGLFIIFLCSVIPQLLFSFSNFSNDTTNPYKRAFVFVWTIILIIYIYLIIHCGSGLLRLRKNIIDGEQ